MCIFYMYIHMYYIYTYIILPWLVLISCHWISKYCIVLVIHLRKLPEVRIFMGGAVSLPSGIFQNVFTPDLRGQLAVVY